MRRRRDRTTRSGLGPPDLGDPDDAFQEVGAETQRQAPRRAGLGARSGELEVSDGLVDAVLQACRDRPDEGQLRVLRGLRPREPPAIGGRASARSRSGLDLRGHEPRRGRHVAGRDRVVGGLLDRRAFEPGGRPCVQHRHELRSGPFSSRRRASANSWCSEYHSPALSTETNRLARSRSASTSPDPVVPTTASHRLR